MYKYAIIFNRKRHKALIKIAYIKKYLYKTYMESILYYIRHIGYKIKNITSSININNYYDHMKKISSNNIVYYITEMTLFSKSLIDKLKINNNPCIVLFYKNKYICLDRSMNKKKVRILIDSFIDAKKIKYKPNYYY